MRGERRGCWRAATIVLAGLLACDRAPAPRREPPLRNVLLISIDSLRADRLGCYGHDRDTSPTLDRLAAEGVRFANAQTPSSWTLPAHATLLSGAAQARHGATTADGSVAADVPLLAEMLRERGVHTAGFYSGPFLHPAFGFDRGFDAYVACQEPETAAQPSAERALDRSHQDTTNPLVEAAVRRWAESPPATPFFAFVHLWDVHYDYIPPARYVEMFDPEYRGRIDGRDIIEAGFPLDIAPRDLAHLLARYDGEIRWTDDTIATMLRVLETAGLLDDTLVVVTADHGDEFLEHGDKGHQKTLYEEVTRVPLIFWAARGLPAGRVVETPVTLADVVPTVLDVLGMTPPPGLAGRSLVPLWRGETTQHPPVTGLLFLTYGGGGALVQATIRDGQRKVRFLPNRRQWHEYALDRDPSEQTPLAVTRTDLQADLTSRMTEASRTLVRQLAANAAQRTTPAVPAHVTEHLRALGYVE
jgi:arylsulfatase A-like enzyme